MLTVGARVDTEWGPGTVTHSSPRRAVVALDDGGTLNVSTGTPGYSRLVQW